MKRTLLSLAALLFTLAAGAQFNYTFSYGNQPYVPVMSGAATPLVTAPWNNIDISLNPPFAFQLNGAPAAVPALVADNLLAADYSASSTDYLFFTVADLVDQGMSTGTLMSPIVQAVSGTTPNRVLTIEYQAAGFNGDPNTAGSNPDYTNIQIRVYETTNVIEFHYGASQVNGYNTYFDGLINSIGLLNSFNINTGSVQDIYFLKGDPNAPTMDSTDDFIGFVTGSGLTGWPAEGTYYRFTPTGADTTGTDTTGTDTTTTRVPVAPAGPRFTVFPTPAGNQVTIGLPGAAADAALLDMQGRVVRKQRLAHGENEVPLSNVPAGIYLLRVTDAEGTATKRLVIRH